MKWTEHPFSTRIEKERMLRTSLQAELLKLASKSKIAGQSFVHCKDNLVKDWNHSTLIFRNWSYRKIGLWNYLLCSLKLSSALVSRIQICSPWIHHLPWYPGYNLFSLGISDFFFLSGVCLASVLMSWTVCLCMLPSAGFINLWLMPAKLCKDLWTLGLLRVYVVGYVCTV